MMRTQSANFARLQTLERTIKSRSIWHTVPQLRYDHDYGENGDEMDESGVNFYLDISQDDVSDGGMGKHPAHEEQQHCISPRFYRSLNREFDISRKSWCTIMKRRIAVEIFSIDSETGSHADCEEAADWDGKVRRYIHDAKATGSAVRVEWIEPRLMDLKYLIIVELNVVLIPTGA
jgi:hypothetical protein